MADVINAGKPTSVCEYPVAFLKRKSPPVVVNLKKGQDFDVLEPAAETAIDVEEELGSPELQSTSE